MSPPPATRSVPGRGPWATEARATIALGWPIVLTNIVQIAIHSTDVLMMGALGPESLAAGALGANLHAAMLLFGMGLVMASAPMIATERGARPWSVRDVRRTVRQALWAAAVISVPMWLVLWHTEAICLALGQDPGLSAAAASYVRTLMWGLPFFLTYLVLRSFVSALERPLWSVAIGSAALLFNAVAVYALMFGRLGMPELGLPGAGIGSALTSVFMAGGMAAVVSIDRHFRRYRLFGRFWRADWPRFRALWALGLPIAVTTALEVTIFNASAFLMGLIGTSSVAAYAIAIQVASITFMIPLGLSQAATVRVGLAIGAGDRAAVRRAGWTPFILGLLAMVTAGTAIALFREPIATLFLDPAEPANAEALRLATGFLAVVALFQVVDGAQALASGMLRGLQDTRVPMLYALIGYWGMGLTTGIVLAFPAKMGGIGIWYGLALGLGAVAVLMIQRWMRRARLGLERVAG